MVACISICKFVLCASSNILGIFSYQFVLTTKSVHVLSGANMKLVV